MVVVGAGLAGLATAIRLKQRAAELDGDVAVVVVEGLRSRRPHPLRRGDRSDRPRPPPARMAERSGPAAQDRGYERRVPVPQKSRGLRLPTVTLPKLMDNHGNFVGSLGNVCRYLGRAEALGVEIYPGFPPPRC